MKNNEQTLNAFAYSYQISKMAQHLNDNSFDEIYSMPLPPVKSPSKIEKVPKTFSRPMTESECETAIKQCEDNGILLRI